MFYAVFTFFKRFFGHPLIRCLCGIRIILKISIVPKCNNLRLLPEKQSAYIHKYNCQLQTATFSQDLLVLYSTNKARLAIKKIFIVLKEMRKHVFSFTYSMQIKVDRVDSILGAKLFSFQGRRVVRTPPPSLLILK